MIEAGCWQGGSSAKFSIVCRMLGYGLHIYDSFEGVPPLTDEEKKVSTDYDYSFEYSAEEALVRSNLAKYGELGVCWTHKGLFSETLGAPVGFPVRVVYVDCDTAPGTKQVIEGVRGALALDGVIYSQDFHIPPVARLLENPELWESVGPGRPSLQRLCGNLASVRLNPLP